MTITMTVLSNDYFIIVYAIFDQVFIFISPIFDGTKGIMIYKFYVYCIVGFLNLRQ